MSIRCASDRAFSRLESLEYTDGVESSRGISLADGECPVINSCGEYVVDSCFHELCANSAIGSSALQLSCLPLTKLRR
jgi:hypothetical protein